MTQYAKRDIHAEVDEEGGRINRLVAAAGQPISPAYLQYVGEGDRTTDVDEAHDVVVGRATSARRAAAAAAAEAGAPDAGNSASKPGRASGKAKG